MSDYITLKMPVIGTGIWGDPLRAKYQDDFNGVPFKRHYRVMWYGKQLPKHKLMKRIIARVMRRGLPSYETWVDVVVKDCPLDLRRKLLNHDDVTFIETPDERRFGNDEEENRRMSEVRGGSTPRRR